MGRLVVGGRHVAVLHEAEQRLPPRGERSTKTRTVGHVGFSREETRELGRQGDYAGYSNQRIHANKARTQGLIADLTLVREHFGAGISDAFRLSIRLVANAIREGRMTP